MGRKDRAMLKVLWATCAVGLLVLAGGTTPLLLQFSPSSHFKIIPLAPNSHVVDGQIESVAQSVVASLQELKLPARVRRLKSQTIIIDSMNTQGPCFRIKLSESYWDGDRQRTLLKIDWDKGRDDLIL